MDLNVIIEFLKMNWMYILIGILAIKGFTMLTNLIFKIGMLSIAGLVICRVFFNI